MKVLVFSVAGTRIGMSIEDVVESVRAVEVTPLPGAPPVVEGIIDYRGTIAAVFDMGRRFVGRTLPVAPDHQFVIARSGSARTVALHVDRIEDLTDVDAANVRPVDAGGSTAQFVAGVTALADGLLIIHDLKTFLTDAERASLESALTAAAT